MTFMKLVQYIFQILVLILMQVDISSQYRGLMKFKDFKLNCCNRGFKVTPKHRTISKRDCIQCDGYLLMCLILADSDSSSRCLIKATKMINIDEENFVVLLNETAAYGMNLVLRVVNKSQVLLRQMRFYNRLTFKDSQWYTVNSTQNFVAPFKYTLSCPKNYYGPTCDKECFPRDDGLGHYNCAANGSKICYPNYYGQYCNKKCQCKKCDQNGRCICKFGWEGINCQTDRKLCVTVGCRNKGKCNTVSGKCTCGVTYTGQYCEQAILPPKSSVRYSKSSHTTLEPSTSFIISQIVFNSSTSRLLTTLSSSNSLNTTFKVQSPSAHKPTIKSTLQILRSSLSQRISKSKSTTFLYSTTTNTKFSTDIGTSIKGSPSSIITAAPEGLSTTARLKSTLCLVSFPTDKYSSSIRYITSSSIRSEQNQSTYSKDVLLLISRTVWVQVQNSTEGINSSTIPSTQFNHSIIIIPITVSTFILFVVVFVLLLWKRKKHLQRKRQAPTIIPISHDNVSIESRPSTISSGRSITPLMRYFFNQERGSGQESTEIERMSSLEYPYNNNHQKKTSIAEQKDEKYSVKAIDQLCKEIIRGHKRSIGGSIKPNNSEERKHRFSNAFSDRSRKSQTSTGYCSSGYWSDSNTPIQLDLNLAFSLMMPYSYDNKGQSINETQLVDGTTEQENKSKRFHHLHQHQYTDCTEKNPLSASRKNSNHSNSRKSSQGNYPDELYLTSLSSHNTVKFKDLPNFVSYKEDTI